MPASAFFTEEREQIISDILKEKKRVTVSELSQLFDTSAPTIRKQLKKMECEGKLHRTHGGAISIDSVVEEVPFFSKYIQNLPEKEAIAKAALQFIRPGDVIMLGGGTTILELAKLLKSASDLIVITNSLPAAMELFPNRNIEVQICSGTIREKSGVIVGPTALQYLKDLSVTKTFVGADSISAKCGLTTPNTFEAESEHQLISCAHTVFVLADHSKMDRIALVKQTPLRQIDYIITDTKTDAAFAEKLHDAGIKVLSV